MIAEVRKVTFSTSELSTAVQKYLEATRGARREDRIIDIVKNQRTGALAITVQPIRSSERTVFELKPEAVAALMVAHCIRMKIPLPRRATKPIAVDGDQLSARAHNEAISAAARPGTVR